MSIEISGLTTMKCVIIHFQIGDFILRTIIYMALDANQDEYPSNMMEFYNRWKNAMLVLFDVEIQLKKEPIFNLLPGIRIKADASEWQEFYDSRTTTNRNYRRMGINFIKFLSHHISLDIKEFKHYRVDLITHPHFYKNELYVWDFDFYMGSCNMNVVFSDHIQINLTFSRLESIIAIEFHLDDDMNVMSSEIIPTGDDVHEFENIILDKNIMLNLLKMTYYNGFNKALLDSNDESFNKILLEVIHGDIKSVENFCNLQEMISI